MLGMWDRDEEKRLGDHYKELEFAEISSENETLYPYEAFVIRVDGRAFHTFTRGMTKPFSTVLDECRNAAAEAVLKSLKPTFAYHQSDEISFVWDVVKEPATEHPFGGRATKLLTLVASLTSTAFLKKYIELTGDFSKLPHFDARIAGRFSSQRTALEDAIRCVQWRENDALRNSMQMYGQSIFSHKELNKKSVGDIYDMAKEKGFDWFEAAPEFRRGTYLTIGTVQVPIKEEQRLLIPEKHRPEAGATVTRSAMIKHFFEDWDIPTRVRALAEEFDV
ncbi:tRNAHis guanylyltransferase [compost metagenome]